MKMKQKTLLFTILAFSPVGSPLIYILLDQLNICSGSVFSSGIECSLPLGNYIANVAQSFEASWFVVVPGLLWLIASIAVWVYTILYISLTLTGKGELAIREIALLSSKKSRKQRSFLFKVFQALFLLLLIVATVIAIVVAAGFFDLL